MVIFIKNGKEKPTELSWEEKNSGDYSYQEKDYRKIDEFFSEFEKNKSTYGKLESKEINF